MRKVTVANKKQQRFGGIIEFNVTVLGTLITRT